MPDHQWRAPKLVLNKLAIGSRLVDKPPGRGVALSAQYEITFSLLSPRLFRANETRPSVVQ
jgi:hypothetical protein